MRNHLLFTDKQLTTDEIVAKSISEARFWKIAQEARSHEVIVPRIESRIPEITSQFVGYVDAAWNATSSFCGMGWALSFDESSSVFTPSNSSPSVYSALVVETRAMISAMIYSLRMGCYNITMRSDSKTLIRLLNSTKTHVEVDVLLEDIRLLILSFESIVFQFVPRSVSTVADDLAKKALLSFVQIVSNLSV